MRAMQAIGHRMWAIAEGFIPDGSTGGEEMTSHETLCVLNAADEDANVELTVYFADREPVGPYRLRVPARRTLHLWFNDLDDPEPIPRATDYATLVRSDVPVVVQHTRIDTRQPALGLLSTMAHPITG
jgi:hypothetical protein